MVNLKNATFSTNGINKAIGSFLISMIFKEMPLNF